MTDANLEAMRAMVTAWTGQYDEWSARRAPWNIRPGQSPALCRFSAAGMTVSPRTAKAGGRKAPRHEIAGWERRWCRNYGDFAAGSGVDVGERGSNVGNLARRHGPELSCERVTDRLCNAILRS